MERTTLKECIDVFNTNELMQYQAIRMMENISEWETAAIYWKKLKRSEDEKACSYLANAIKRGDSYRAEVKELNDWVDKTVSEGIMSKDEAIKIINPKMDAIYKKYYN